MEKQVQRPAISDSLNDRTKTRLSELLVAELYRQIPTIAAGLTVVVALNAWFYWSRLPAWTLLVWAGLFSLHMIPRLLTYVAYRRNAGRLRPEGWQRLFIVQSVLLGLCWTWLISVVVLTLPAHDAVVAMITIMGIVAASVATTSAAPSAYLAIGTTTTLPAGLLMLFQDESVYRAAGALVMVYLLTMVRSSRWIHQSIRRTVTYSLRNETLVRQLEAISSQDALTGLSNRRALDIGLEQIWATATQTGASVGMVVCDIDFFKQYNDALGHQAGDECLKRVATAISGAVRSGEAVVARYGGEEFAVVLPNVSLSEVEAIATRLGCAVRDEMITHPASSVAPYVTVSAGASSVSATGCAPSALFAAADAALYRAKVAGRNCVRVQQPTDQDCRSAATRTTAS